jgi:hypothetical protein
MTPNHPTALELVAAVAGVYGISPKDIRSKAKGPTLVEARHLCWWLIRNKTGWSYPEIGRALGTDHTVVMHGVKRTSERVQNKTGTASLQAALTLCAPWVIPKDNHPVILGPADGETSAQPVAQPVACPPSLVLSPSALPSDSQSFSADSGSLLSSDQRPVSKPAREAKPKPRKWTFVPADWQPNDEHRKRARMLRVSLDEEVQKFRDHEFKEPKSDADRAFNRWLRMAANGFGSGPAPGAVAHQAHVVESHRRPELMPLRAPKPVQEATPLEVAAHLGQVLGKRPAAPAQPARRMTPAELDRAVDELRRDRT